MNRLIVCLVFLFTAIQLKAQDSFYTVLQVDSSYELKIGKELHHHYIIPNELVFVNRSTMGEEYTPLIPARYLTQLQDAKHHIWVKQDSILFEWTVFNLKNGKLESDYLVRNKTGDTLIWYQFKNGLQNGYQRRSNGYVDYGLDTWYFVNDTLSGPAQYYDEARGCLVEGTFEKGLRVGMWIEYQSPETKHLNYTNVYYFDGETLRERYENGIRVH
ncbi:MAG: hypothetical protein EP332_09600 [Bacteroidetes bacterium]|nr:MAG: hypothetical protein EP332_09600 [Bacteroidota bacterium]